MGGRWRGKGWGEKDRDGGKSRVKEEEEERREERGERRRGER